MSQQETGTGTAVSGHLFYSKCRNWYKRFYSGDNWLLATLYCTVPAFVHAYILSPFGSDDSQLGCLVDVISKCMSERRAEGCEVNLAGQSSPNQHPT